MDLWSTFERELLNPALGSQALRLSSGDRHNYSLKMVQDRCVLLAPGESAEAHFAQEARYICMKDVSFDLLLTIYDVNTRSMLAMRLTKDLPDAARTRLAKFVSGFKKPTFELRAIGMQNDHKELLPFITQVHEMSKAMLVEADLFGNNLRHLVIDMQTGLPYNLLLQNRIYRPGELLNPMSKEESDKLRGIQ